MYLKKVKIFIITIYKNEDSPFCSLLAAKILYQRYIFLFKHENNLYEN